MVTTSDEPSGRARPRIERLIELAAKGMIAFAILAGGLAALAALGVAWFGPAFAEWASERNTPIAWLFLAFVIWPLLGVAYLAGEALSDYLHGLGRKRENGRRAKKREDPQSIHAADS